MTGRSSSRKTSLLLWLLPLAFLALFYFYPLGSIFSLSFARGTGAGAALLDALGRASIRRVLGFTFWQALLSAALTLLVGLPGAYLLARYRFRGKGLLRALTGIPFVMPTLVVAAAFNALLGPRGWINLALMALFKLDAPPIAFLNTLGAILLAHVFYNLTIVLRMVGDFWGRLDPRLVGAARVLGASRWQAFRSITLPLLLPAISAATLLVFIFDFTSFGVVLILGGPRFSTLEVEIYTQTVSLFNLPLAAALAILQLAATLALTILYTRLSTRISRPLQHRSVQQREVALNTWSRRLFAGGMIALLATLTLLPLGGLALRSVSRLDAQHRQRTEDVQPGLTLEYYRALTEETRQSSFYAPPIRAVLNSLGYAAATVLLALLVGLPASWALAHRPDTLSSRLLDPLLMLPLGTSAVTLGLGFIVALDTPPLDLRTSPLLIPLAHTLVAFPFVVRSMTPALRSIQPRLRQAAAVLGAAPREVLRFIDAPLVGRALLVAATFAFTISLGEFGATALVSRPEYPTLPVMIYRFLSQPGALNLGQALALSTILMVVTTGGMLLIERVRIGEGSEF